MIARRRVPARFREPPSRGLVWVAAPAMSWPRPRVYLMNDVRPTAMALGDGRWE